MLRIVKPTKQNSMQYNYEKSVAARIAPFKDMLGYHFLEQEVQKWIDLHSGDSLDGITARVYMDELLSKSNEEVNTWVQSFITNQIKFAAKNIRYINETTAKIILEHKKESSEIIVGRFIYHADSLFHGIDTITGVLKEASFPKKFDCLDWLLLDEKPTL